MILQLFANEREDGKVCDLNFKLNSKLSNYSSLT